MLETRSTPPLLADSVILGALSSVLGSAALGMALLARGGHLSSDTILDAASVGFFAAPLLALLNLVFVGRDLQAGRSRAAIVGAMLSGITILVAVVSLALAD